MMTTPEPKKWVRSDDDEWDIVSSVGYTALVVAAWRALHATSPSPLVRDEYAKHFITASADPFLTRLLANAPISEDATVFPRLYGVQTRFFDDFFRSANGGGIRQAVILAAGLDSRAYRLEWPTETTVFEVDQPKVLEFKARVLNEQSAEPTAHRKEIAVDLRDDWSTPLRAAGLDPHKPTAWSVEGLLPYLTDAAQDALFARIDHLSAPGSHLAVGALGSHYDPTQFAALAAAHPEVNISGAVDFSALTYDSHNRLNPADWLAEHDWAVLTVSTTIELRARYRRPVPAVDARVDSVLRSQYITATK
jgi:methyltransferase (TIGR00027 family)